MDFECPKCKKKYDREYGRKNKYCTDCNMRLTIFKETPSTLIVKTKTNPKLELRSIDYWAYFKDLESIDELTQKRDFRIIRVSGDSVVILLQDGSERTITYTDYFPIWNKYVQTRSEKISDYTAISKNAIYIVPMIPFFLESQGVEKPKISLTKVKQSSPEDEKEIMNKKIVDILIKQGESLLSQNKKFETLSNNTKAETLLNDIENYPHAFLFACVIDSPTSNENTWDVPYLFMERVGSTEFEDIQKLSLEDVTKLFSEPTPLHLYPDMMAKVLYRAIQDIETKYSGDASKIWSDNPTSETLVHRFNDFYGVGPKIANMSANILIRQFNIPLQDKISINISPNINTQRVFQRLGLISENASTEELISKAKELFPFYPAIFDYSITEIAKKWCKPTNTDCKSCYLMNYCPSKFLY